MTRGTRKAAAQRAASTKPEPVSRPRIYGDERKCRAAIARYIARADELLDQAEGVRARMSSNDDRRLLAEFIEVEWAQEVRRWLTNAQRGLGRFLQDQFGDVLPLLASGLPPDTGKPRHDVRLDNGEPWLRETLEELRGLQDTLGVRRGVAKESPRTVLFAELRASGLVAEKVVLDHEKDMLNPRTPRQLSNAIGSAKELTEATLRAALDRLGQPYSKQDDLPRLMKKWRQAVEEVASPDPQGQQTLSQVQAALGNLIKFLAEWRNPYGRGHGRPEYPAGLMPRHARLAVDVAETAIRFIVTTMDDLERLPP